MAEDFESQIGDDSLPGPVHEEELPIPNPALKGHDAQVEESDPPQAVKVARDNVAVDGDFEQIGANDLKA
jgi:hypothetical protein